MRLPLAIGVLVACGPSSRVGNGDDVAVFPDGDVIVTPIGDASDASQVYAHSGTTLYRVDTNTFEPVMVGVMSGLGTQSLTDLAIDKTGLMVGITLDKLYDIDSSSGSVSLVRALTGSATGLTSLSYIPTNLSDPNSTDILVSANDQGDVFQLDSVTGDATLLGSYGSNAQGKIISSGDLIGVRNPRHLR